MRPRASSATTPAADAGSPLRRGLGRKGQGVKADDLLDRLIDKAAGGSRQAQRRADAPKRRARLPPPSRPPRCATSWSSSRAARSSSFDIDEALSFEGESGPYLQYAVVRANNIFHKLQERYGVDEAAVVTAVPQTSAGRAHRDTDEAHDLWGLMLEAARLDEVVEQSVRTLELSVLAKYAFGLAQAFNGFYHKYSILNEEREDVRIWRAAAVAYYRAQLTRALELMGCTVPAKM